MSIQKTLNLCVLAAFIWVPLAFAQEQQPQRRRQAADSAEPQTQQRMQDRPFTPQERAMIRRYIRERIEQRRAQDTPEQRRARADQPRPRDEARRQGDDMRRPLADRGGRFGPHWQPRWTPQMRQRDRRSGPPAVRGPMRRPDRGPGRRYWSDRPHNRMRGAPDRRPYARPYRDQWQGPEHWRPRWDRDQRHADRRHFQDRWTQRRRQDEQMPPRRRGMDRPERVEPDDEKPIDPPRPRYRRDRDAQ